MKAHIHDKLPHVIGLESVTVNHKADHIASLAYVRPIIAEEYFAADKSAKAERYAKHLIKSREMWVKRHREYKKAKSIETPVKARRSRS